MSRMNSAAPLISGYARRTKASLPEKERRRNHRSGHTDFLLASKSSLNEYLLKLKTGRIG